MTAALLILTFFVALPLLIARAIALGSRPAPPPVVHLLTARQAAKAVGVSVAAVQAWQRDGLLPVATCAGCPHASIPPTALVPLLAHRDATVDLTLTATKAARATDAALVAALRALREDEEALPAERRGAEAGSWVAMSRNRWPA